MQSFSPKKHVGRAARLQSQPLDRARLNALALAYVARFATSASKLEAYLLRKLQASLPGSSRADDAAADDPDPQAMRREITDLVARFVAAGYVDDRAFAAARSGGLQRRGYGGRHIAQTLGQAGIASEVVAAVLPDRSAGRQAALALARKRRLGPFGTANLEQGRLNRAGREKQIAMLLRAGHPLDSARVLVNAASIAEAERWAQPETGDPDFEENA